LSKICEADSVRMGYNRAMKARSYPVVLSALLGLLVSVARADDGADLSSAFLDPADPAVLEIRRLGEWTLDRAGVMMQTEVRRVLADTAPAMAIGVMHLKDYKPPAPAPGKPAVTGLRRTSLQVRNPANAADATDRAVLERIKEQLDQGDPVSKIFVLQVTQQGQPGEWRVYRPLVVIKQCLVCHGSPANLAPGVQDALKIFYPHDAAVDYQEGAWRGLMRVTITVPPAGK
jgi:hypothetical protein